MPDPRLVMATVSDQLGEEAEPVTVEVDGQVVHLTLDDGIDIAIAVDDLREALAA